MLVKIASPNIRVPEEKPFKTI